MTNGKIDATAHQLLAEAYEKMGDRGNLAIAADIRSGVDSGYSARIALKAVSAALVQADAIGAAREAFLNMIADADRWDEDVDGDCDGDGRPQVFINYDLRVGHSQLQELCDTLGIKPKRYDQTLKDAIDEMIAAPAAARSEGE